MPFLENVIQTAIKYKASDIHLHQGMPALFRINNSLVSLPEFADFLSEDILLDSICRLCNSADKNTVLNYLDKKDSLDLAQEITGTRCRINVFSNADGYALAIRVLNNIITPMKKLRLPLSVQNLTKESHGLIIFSGPTGSGKTTSIASFLDEVNQQDSKHIISIEDPIEIVHRPNKSLISQREVGYHCKGYLQGLKSALREDPDIIFIGEMRDPETVQTALTAAETGHLVLTTLHSANCIEAVDRLTQFFPIEAHNQVVNQIANCMKGIIAQKLLLKADNSGRIAAYEVLLSNTATRNIIRHGQLHRLSEYMVRDGMQTFDLSVQGLKELGLIS